MDGLARFERHFSEIEICIAPAKWVPWDGRFNWRFVERTPGQLLIQKLARQASALHAIDVLLMAGRLPDIGTLYRQLDEVGEDIAFVSLGLIKECWTPDHQAYYYFWSEDGPRGPSVQRKTIRNFVHSNSGQADVAAANRTGRLLHGAYSDYVHARSAPTMGMMRGPPPRFDLNAIFNAGARAPYDEQHPAYFYRGLISCGMVAKALLPEEKNSEIFRDIKAYERAYGRLLFPEEKVAGR
jgi:hypothetical protein